MKIKDKRRLCEDFGSLMRGDVFSLDENGIFYMKIVDVHMEDEVIGNGISLRDGEMLCIADECLVYPVNCELVIE